MSLGGSLAGSLAESFGASLAGGGATSVQTPLDVLGSRLKHWANGEEENIVYGVNPAVETATDLSAGGRDITQATSSRHPDRFTTAGGNGALQCVAASSGSLKITGEANDMWAIGDFVGFGVAFEIPTDPATTEQWVYVVDNGTSFTGFQFHYEEVGGNLDCVFYTSAGTKTVSFAFTPAAGYHYLLAWGDGSDVHASLDGTPGSTSGSGAMANACGDSIGLAADPHRFPQTTVNVVTAFTFADTSAISSADQADLLAYLATKAA